MRRASIVIRAKDEAASIGRTLGLLAGQDVADLLGTIVVDSGSKDSTVSIARDAGADVVEMPAREFTLGRSLNLGCAAADGDIVIALSAHAFPPDRGWVQRMLDAFDDDRVACACGYGTDPHGAVLTGPRVQDVEDLRRHPMWGYTNASGAFRRDLWSERPFREDLPGTEDKEWAGYWVSRGHLSIVDPALSVSTITHDEGPVLTYRRSRREWEGYAMYLDLPPYGLADLARDWWHASGTRRAGWRRSVALAGEWRGRRRGRGR